MKLNIPSDDHHDNGAYTPGHSDDSEAKYPKKNSFSLLVAAEPLQKKRNTRAVIFVACLSLLVIGRFSVPLIKPVCVTDVLQEYFKDLTNYILADDNTAIRNTLQILCSLFMDGMFFATGIYWILYGSSSRLFVSVISFYVVRAAVQALWMSPFPDVYWWDSPGLPSFVVPYGQGSDFFFSGHVGFTVICASEWFKNGYPRVAKGFLCGAVYVAFILLIYHVHYFIDLFTGAFFGHYMFMMVDKRKERLDKFFIGLYYNGKVYLQTVFGNKGSDVEMESLREV